MYRMRSDADLDLWIRICIIKVGSVWRDTDPDPGHSRTYPVIVKKQAMANN